MKLFTPKHFIDNMEVIPGECDTFESAAAVANMILGEWLKDAPTVYQTKSKQRTSWKEPMLWSEHAYPDSEYCWVERTAKLVSIKSTERTIKKEVREALEEISE